MGFKVFNKPCNQCLLTPRRIVSSERMKQIIEDCKKDQTYFICHKSKGNDDICCKKFYSNLGEFSQQIRIAERLNVVEFVDLTEYENSASPQD